MFHPPFKLLSLLPVLLASLVILSFGAAANVTPAQAGTCDVDMSCEPPSSGCGVDQSCQPSGPVLKKPYSYDPNHR